MTTTTPQDPLPGSQGPFPAAPPPAPAPRRRPRWVIVAVAAAVAFVGGFVAYLIDVGGFFVREVRTTADCGEHDACIPNLRGADVVAALEQRGHTCEEGGVNEEHPITICSLDIGVTRFEANIHTVSGDDGITSIAAAMHSLDEADGGLPADHQISHLEYLTWFATLPWTHDEEVAAEVTAWVQQELGKSPEELAAQFGGEGARVQVDEYEYRMHTSGPRNFTMRVTARGDI